MATTPNQDSATTSIPVTLRFTVQGKACLPPSVVEALEAAQLRIDLPQTTASSSAVTISTLEDNITKLDSTGAIYTPAAVKTSLTSQSATLDENAAPGTFVDLIFSTQGITDLDNTFPFMLFEYNPPDAAVNGFGPLVENGNLRWRFTRQDIGGSAPYPVVVIRGSGRLLTLPSPTT